MGLIAALSSVSGAQRDVFNPFQKHDLRHFGFVSSLGLNGQFPLFGFQRANVAKKQHADGFAQKLTSSPAKAQANGPC